MKKTIDILSIIGLAALVIGFINTVFFNLTGIIFLLGLMFLSIVDSLNKIEKIIAIKFHIFYIIFMMLCTYLEVLS
jgi:hypothetical protein